MKLFIDGKDEGREPTLTFKLHAASDSGSVYVQARKENGDVYALFSVHPNGEVHMYVSGLIATGLRTAD